MVYVRDRLKNVVVAKEAITSASRDWSEIQIVSDKCSREATDRVLLGSSLHLLALLN